MMFALPEDVFAFTRNAFIHEIWPREDRSTTQCIEMVNMLTNYKMRYLKSCHGNNCLQDKHEDDFYHPSSYL